MSDNISLAIDEIWDESGFLIGFAGALSPVKSIPNEKSSDDANQKLMYVSDNTSSPIDLKDLGAS
jgi:hypothetical protein